MFHLKEKRELKKKINISVSNNSTLSTEPSTSNFQDEPATNINIYCNYCGNLVENFVNCELCKKSIHKNVSCVVYSNKMYICLNCLNK